MLTVTGVIYLAATPIGNVGDASPRLREVLETADCIAAEDTRRLKALCARLDVRYTGDVLRLDEHVETERAGELIGRAQAGQTVVVVSDAGTPTVSDPGFRVGQVAIAAGVKLRPLPGPSAALAALSVSGLPSDRFAFEGFLPRKTGEMRRRLDDVATDPRTLIFFESPRRLLATLRAMAERFGPDRPAAVCRELTKTYEEVLRGTLTDVIEAVGPEPRGEITIVVGGATNDSENMDDLVEEVLRLSDAGMRLKAAAAEVASRTGARKNDLYQAALDRR